ncbi:MAG: DUF502 domain-containing protein [bacterium]
MEAKTRSRNYFITGLITILPLALSLYILWIILSFIGRQTYPIFRKLFEIMEINYSPFLETGVSVILTAALIWLIGLIATNILGRRLFLMFEKLVIRIPILKGFYSSIKQLLTHISSAKAFKQVVLVEYPRMGIYSIGFVTCDANGEIQDTTKDFVINVFIPTTPNPTSGMLIMVPKKDLIYLRMSIDDAVKFVISGGIVTQKNADQQKILDEENL